MTKIGLIKNSENRVIDSDNDEKDVGGCKAVPVLDKQYEEIQKIQKYLKDEFGLEVTDIHICVKAMEVGLLHIKSCIDWTQWIMGPV